MSAVAKPAGVTLAVDYGEVRMGLAICEAPTVPAVPLTTILRTSRAKDIASILRVAREREVAVIVVGLPLRLDGSSGPAAKKVETFIGALRAAFAGAVIAQDERMTTAAAARKLRDIAISGNKKRRYIDQLAAVEILSSYLATQRKT